MGDEDFVQRLKEATNIVELIGEHVVLRRRGAKWWGLSPFKHERTPSFSVDESRGLWYCFSTQQGGDVIRFLQAHLNLDFRSALEHLAKRSGIPMPARAPGRGGDDAEDALKSQLYQLHEQVASWWHDRLEKAPDAAVAREYLARRGVSPETARTFLIGHAPDSWDATRTWAHARGFSDEVLEKAGLLVAPEDRPGRRYDRFRGRLMFPICSEAGRVIAFSGRVLDAEAKEAKYVNSPETMLFSKGRVLFGLDKNKRELIAERRAILCEGPLDLITCHQAGVRNLLAPQGTAFTEQQARILARHVDEVVLCFDSDDAGRRAVLRAGPLLLAASLAVRVLQLPAAADGTKHDPDSFVRANGAEALKSLAASAPEYWPHVVDHLAQTHDVSSERGRAGFRRALFEMLAGASPGQREAVFLMAAPRLGTTAVAMESDFHRARIRPAGPGPAPAPVADADRPMRPDRRVEDLLLLLLQHPGLVPDAQRSLHPEWVNSLDGGALVLELLAAHGDDDWLGAEHWAETRPAAERRYLLMALQRSRPAGGPEALADCLSTLEEAWLASQVEACRARVREGGDAHAYQQLIDFLGRLTQFKRLRSSSASRD
jgi:DNA primase